MTRLLLLTLFLLSSATAYAEWVSIRVSQSGTTTYVDRDTIHRTGDLVKMWELNDYKATHTNAGKSSWSHKALNVYDCAEEQSRELAEYDYSGQMGTGEIVYSSTSPDKWVPVIPGSVGKALWKFACKKP